MHIQPRPGKTLAQCVVSSHPIWPTPPPSIPWRDFLPKALCKIVSELEGPTLIHLHTTFFKEAESYSTHTYIIFLVWVATYFACNKWHFPAVDIF